MLIWQTQKIIVLSTCVEGGPVWTRKAFDGTLCHNSHDSLYGDSVLHFLFNNQRKVESQLNRLMLQSCNPAILYQIAATTYTTATVTTDTTFTTAMPQILSCSQREFLGWLL